MLVVVESGSTKADWLIRSSEGDEVCTTKGFNPYFHSKDAILFELNSHQFLKRIKDKVTRLYFYGAGCSGGELNAIIASGLSPFFVNASIHVDHDLSACALACYRGKPEIACILGTGSNSCYYDGKALREEVPSLGHILGDEGSGTYFGKRLLADFLYKRLPTEMDKALQELGLDKSTIINKVYREPNRNVFIASLMPVLIRYKDLPYSQQLIRQGFHEFVDIHVKCFEEYKHCEVNFVGSVASLLEKELRTVCNESEINIGRIVRRPLQNLAKYHLAYD